ncbi:MAG: hypothetical protein Q9163_001816 [Psora crenata]
MSPVPQSASKWEFLLALGLDCSYEPHKDLYSQMKAEATRVYDTQLSTRAALRPEHRSSPAPWSNSQFTDSAIREAVASIYANASPLTAQLYRRGRPGGDNWVARWVLYHVCRYRDSRNKKARSSKFEDDDEFFGPRPRES